jgi:hypothetical protein
MTDRPRVTDHSARTHVGTRPLRWPAAVVSRGLRASAVNTPHTRSTHTKPAAAVCAILGASLLAVGAVLMKPVESSGIFARIDGANGSIDPHQESNMKTSHAFRTAGALGALAVTQIALVSGASAQSSAVQWRVEDGGNGHWYRMVAPGTIGWYEARSLALGMGGDLASITSLEESEFVLMVTSDLSGWTPSGQLFVGPWLGGYQDHSASDYNEPAGGWRWVSGEPWQFTRWMAPEPNNGWGGGEDFLNLLTQPPIIGISPNWNDCPTNCLTKSLVVEWSADCNSDGIIDYGQCLDSSLLDTNGNNIPDCCEQGNPCSLCSACDLNPNGIVDGADLGALLAFWGPVSPAFPRADINRDGVVNGADLGILLANWGPCGQ